MRKNLLFLVLLCMMAIGAQRSWADEVQNYTFNFDDPSAIGTLSTASWGDPSFADHDFAPNGWGHIVDVFHDESSWNGDTYVSYNYSSSAGVEGSGAIFAGSQTATDSRTYDDVPLYDLLVTPLVNGKISIEGRKRYSFYNAFIEFYKVTKNSDGSFTRGEQIQPDEAVTFTDEGYTTISATLTEDTYVGIRASYMYIDNFKAEKANVERTPKLSINSATSLNEGTTIDANEMNQARLRFRVVLTNSGMVDFAPGDANYSLSFMTSENGDTIFTWPINVAMAQGDKDTLEVNLPIDASTLNGEHDFYLKENISGRTAALGSFDILPYEPDMNVTRLGNSSALTGKLNFGASQKSLTAQIVLHNDGAAPVSLTSIATTAPFTVDQASATIAAHAADTLTITLPNTTPGSYNGTLALRGNVDDYNLQLVGTIVDSTLWYQDFEATTTPYDYPAGMMAEVLSGSKHSQWQLKQMDNSYDFGSVNRRLIANESSDNMTKLVTPLLEVRDGETFSFDAAKRERSGSSYNWNNKSVLKVYYSPDRHNWTLAYTVTADTTNNNAQDYFSNEVLGSTSYYSEPNFAFDHYTVSGIPAGQWYLAFEAGYVRLDNLMGFHPVSVAHDVAASSFDVAANGMVNYKMTVQAGFTNLNTKAEQAADYKVELLDGADVVGTAASADIQPNGVGTFSFDFTPHAAGQHKLLVRLTFSDGYLATTDTATVDVAAEMAMGQKTVGSFNAATTAPIFPYYNYSEGAVVYPASVLGLSAGAKISSITFRGASAKTCDHNLKVYVGNTTETQWPELVTDLNSVADTAAMTKMFDGVMTINEVGRISGYGTSVTITSSGDLFTVNFPQPFVYDGNSLVVYAYDRPEGYVNVYFEGDDSYTNLATRRASDSGLQSASYSNVSMPVIVLGVESTSPVISGTVSAQDGTAISDVVVKLEDDGVVYSDTTKADGKYSITIMQNDRSYKLSAVKAGYDPFEVNNLTVAADTTLAITMTEATGLAVRGSEIPARAEVNSRYTASASVLNTIADDIPAGAYTAQLFFDSKAVASVEGKAVKAGETVADTVSFVPHAEGTFPAYILYTYNGHEYTTDTVQVAVAAESFGGYVQVGDSTGLNNISRSGAPWNNYFKYTQTETIYPASKLGLQAGSVIRSIAFRGTFSQTPTYASGREAARIYLANTTDEMTEGTELHTNVDTAAMTCVFNDTIDYPGELYNRNVGEIIHVDMPKGFVYTGGNLRLVFVGNHDFGGSIDNTIYFVTDESYKNTWTRCNDYGADNGTWEVSSAGTPVMYMTVDNEKTLTGKVMARRDSAAISGASVKIEKDGVEYHATTDAEGNYQMTVGKPMVYNAIISADGYLSDTLTVDFTTAKADTLDALLSKTYYLHGNVATIVDDSTVAVADAQVTLAYADTTLTTQTADDGSYSFSLIDAPAEVSITAQADGYVAMAEPLTVSVSTDTVSVDTIRLVKYLNITGAVYYKGLSGNSLTAATPLSGATVTLLSAAGEAVATATSAADGSYSFGQLVAGNYTIVATAEGYNTGSVSVVLGTADVTADSLTLLTDEATGINSISGNAAAEADVTVYTIGGAKVAGGRGAAARLQRGAYIVVDKNGRSRKVTVK